MSRVCELTGKSAKVVNSRSHSNIATKRKQGVNLQTVSIGGRKFRVAARTKRTLEKLAKQYSGEIKSKKQKKMEKQAMRKKLAVVKK
jgi:ribosomal protein L28